MKKRNFAALLVGGVVFAAAFALAAPLTVNADGLGAGVDLVASCDSSVDVTYDVAYPIPAPSGEYVVTSITVGDMDPACIGQSLEFTLSSDTGPALPYTSGPETITGTSQTFVVVGPGFPADELTDVAVVIAGSGGV